MLTKLLTCAALSLALLPATASAGDVGVPPSDTALEAPTCNGGCAGRYSVSAPSAGGEIVIDPVDGRAFDNGEAAWIDLPSPFEGPVAGVANYDVVLDVAGSSFGENWQAVLCRPAAPTETGRVCTAAAPILASRGNAARYTLQSPDQKARVALQYTGSSGNPGTSLIALRARARWIANDVAAPALDATIGGKPLGADLKIGGANGGEPPIELNGEAEDNYGVAGVRLTLDGKAQDVGAAGGKLAVPDGKHEFSASSCDVAAPANCSSASGSATIDTVAPVVSLPPVVASKSGRPAIPVKAADPPKDGFASGLAGTAALEVGDNQIIDATVAGAGDGLTVTPNAELPEGRYEGLGVQVPDKFGNVGKPAGDPVPLVVDRTPPSVAPANPVPKTRIAAGSRPELAATVVEAGGVASMRLELDGAAITAATLDEGRLNYTTQGVLCAGRRVMSATVTDFVGQTDRTTWSFVVGGTQSRACARAACRRSQATVKRLERQLSADRRSLSRARKAKKRTLVRSLTRKVSRERRELTRERRTAGVRCRAAARRR